MNQINNNEMLQLLRHLTQKREEDSQLIKSVVANIASIDQRLNNIESGLDKVRGLDKGINHISEKENNLSSDRNGSSNGRALHYIGNNDQNIAVQQDGASPAHDKAYTYEFTLNSFRQLRQTLSSRDSEVWHFGKDNCHLMARIEFTNVNRRHGRKHNNDQSQDRIRLSLWSARCRQSTVCAGPRMYVKVDVKVIARDKSSDDVSVVGMQTNKSGAQIVLDRSLPHVINLQTNGEWLEWWRCDNVGQDDENDGDGGCDELLRQGLVAGDAITVRLTLREL